MRATVTLLGCAALLAGCDEACASSELDVLADSVWLELLGVPRCDPPAGDPLPRSSYLRSFDEERDAALELAVVRGVSELTLYGLGDALRQDPGAIAAFVTAAGARGVAVVAPVSDLERVELLTRYERDHPNARFAGWVTEHEFWNGPADERSARFMELQAILTAMRDAKNEGWVACYLGYPTAEEAKWIAERVDRVYLSMSVSNPRDALRYGRGVRSHRARHAYFAGRVPIWPIVYARGDRHMRPWLEHHTIEELDASLRGALHGELAGVALFDFASTPGLAR